MKQNVTIRHKILHFHHFMVTICNVYLRKRRPINFRSIFFAIIFTNIAWLSSTPHPLAPIRTSCLSHLCHACPSPFQSYLKTLELEGWICPCYASKKLYRLHYLLYMLAKPFPTSQRKSIPWNCRAMQSAV